MTRAKNNAVEKRAMAELAASGIMQNPYFQALQDGSMSKEAFARGQQQFYFAVSFYSRPMAILLARLPDLGSRIDLLHNIMDEHGGLDPANSHHSTFLKFLESLGHPLAADTAQSPAVRNFNSVLTAVCAFDEIEVGLACLGIIELAFSAISGTIGAAAIQRGFVAGDGLVHYKLHRKLDVKHADDFFNLLTRSWSSPRGRASIETGLVLGAHIFDRLYRELLLIGQDPAPVALG